MTSDFGLIGNGRVLAKIQADGALTEAFFPSIGFYRHIMQSQFGLFERPKTAPGSGRPQGTPLQGSGSETVSPEPRAVSPLLWFSSRDFEAEQEYVEDTNILRTRFRRGALAFTLIDFVHPETHVIVRRLEVVNNGPEAVELGIFHMEACSLEENKGDFGHNVAYFDSLRNCVVRYRGHPFDNAVEAHACLLIGGQPGQDQIQCGVSYQRGTVDEDAFLDIADGILRHNAYSSGETMGATSALLWIRSVPPRGRQVVSVLLSGDVTLWGAEDRLEAARSRGVDALLAETIAYWRKWLEPGIAREPAFRRSEGGDVDVARLQRLYRRSLLLLKLLQDEQFGSFIAAPNLYPDYRYCWPRDAVYLAVTMDMCGYHEETRRFYVWCKRTQMGDGLWYQNHYTDGRRHWPGIQVDQVGSILWGIWKHYEATGDRGFLREMWTTITRAALYVLSRINPEVGLVYSEQDLWEETGGYLLYTNACCLAGLRAAANAARELAETDEAAMWPPAIDDLDRAIKAKLRQNGIYVGELNPYEPYGVRQDYVLDISTLGIAVPFEVVPADDPVLVRTVELIEKACDYAIGGIGRYASDLFVGGNPWSLAALWMGMYYAAAGKRDRAREYLDWCLKHAACHDFLPEQSDKRTGEPASAVPLGWSHAWVVVLLHMLGQEEAARVDGARLTAQAQDKVQGAGHSVPARDNDAANPEPESPEPRPSAVPHTRSPESSLSTPYPETAANRTTGPSEGKRLPAPNGSARAPAPASSTGGSRRRKG
jgi:oligosaccharide amylase